MADDGRSGTRGSAPGEGAGTRVLREIMRTPAFLDVVRNNIGSLDPEDARGLVRAVLWEDVEVSLGVTGTVPEVVNYLVAAAGEVARQLGGMPPALMERFLERMADEIDLDAIRALPGEFEPLLRSVGLERAAAAAIGGAVNQGAAFVSRAAERNPLFVRDALRAVDSMAVGRACLAVARSLGLWMISGITRVFGRR